MRINVVILVITRECKGFALCQELTLACLCCSRYIGYFLLLVLAPLDSVEVDALLDEFPQGAQLTQEGHTLLDSLENIVDLHLGGEAANAKSDAAVSALVAVTQGSEDVAGLQ